MSVLKPVITVLNPQCYQRDTGCLRQFLGVPRFLGEIAALPRNSEEPEEPDGTRGTRGTPRNPRNSVLVQPRPQIGDLLAHARAVLGRGHQGEIALEQLDGLAVG